MRFGKVRHFQNWWHFAHVIPILKEEGNPRSAISYCPVALKSNLCKVVEQLGNSRLLHFSNSKNLLGNEQCGFRKGPWAVIYFSICRKTFFDFSIFRYRKKITTWHGNMAYSENFILLDYVETCRVSFKKSFLTELLSNYFLTMSLIVQLKNECQRAVVY